MSVSIHSSSSLQEVIAMKQNVGTADRAFRIIVGIVLVGLGVYSQSWWGAVGLAPLLTATVRWCPAYLPFRISTCKQEEPEAS
jgi:predicted transporter